MAVTAAWYGLALKAACNGEWIWGTSVKVALMTGYTPAQDTEDYWNDISASEVSGTGYTAGGQALASPTSTYTGATNILALDAADISWAASIISATYAVLYYNTGTASTSALLGFINFGGTVASNNSTFTITWAAAGILKLTAAAEA